MRDLFHSTPGRPGDELADLCGLVCVSMQHASHALWEADPTLAEQAVTVHAQVKRLAARCARNRCAELTLSRPRTVERRVGVAAMTAADAMVRMGEVACHIAEIVCARHPRPAVPDTLRDPLARMGQLALRSGRHLEQTLAAPVGTYLPALERLDDELSWMHRQLLDTLGQATPPYPARVVADVTSLGRSFERFASRTVAISQQLENAVADRPPEPIAGITPAVQLEPPRRKDAWTAAVDFTDFWAEHPLTRFFRTSGASERVLDAHRRGDHGQCRTCSVDCFVDYPCTVRIHAKLALQPPPRASDQLATLGERRRSRTNRFPGGIEK